MTTAKDLETLAINTIRTLSIDAVEQANSGHPGLPMGAAPMAYTLWMHFLRHNPQNPQWPNRDRFVLSAGHGSMLIYSLLHLTGYDVSLDEIKNFRQWGSITAGHPEYHLTPGVETTTGPLGQGAATAVGMALAESYLAKYFNRENHQVVDHYTYALVSDGDLMEGVAMEASALAGHWGLHKLIYLYDANEITLDGPARMTFTENIRLRYESWGWNVLHVYEGNDTASIAHALETARAQTEKPTIIIINTTIGYGSPNKAGTSKAHGSPLGKEEVRLTKEYYGWPQEAFYIPGEALEHFRSSVERGAEYEAEWQQTFDAWRTAYPDLAQQWDDAYSNRLPEGWDADLPVYETGKQIATRNASGEVLNAIAKHIPTMIGGDADLAGSTKTLIKGGENTGPGNGAERNIRYGVREHGMGAITNGLAAHGGIIRPYSATFLTFSDYMRPAMRIASLMAVPSVYVFTHDSIGLGEDGPTHQPVEHVMSLRAIPQLYVFRPADANETAGAWHTTMMLEYSTAALIFTRQDLPVLENAERIREGVAHGGYVLADCDGTPQVILLSSGSEVHIAHDAYKQLMNEGIKTRVVSLPCWELFNEQDETYRESVLPAGVTRRVSIEAGITLGWQKYVGTQGVTIGIDKFGASAPYERIYEEYGLTPAHVADAARSLVNG